MLTCPYQDRDSAGQKKRKKNQCIRNLSKKISFFKLKKWLQRTLQGRSGEHHLQIKIQLPLVSRRTLVPRHLGTPRSVDSQIPYIKWHSVSTIYPCVLHPQSQPTVDRIHQKK